jgi:hypothetical protein
MTFRRAFSVLAAMCAALVLSGCFVISQNLPAGSGPIGDPRLVGAWRGFDSDEGKDAEAFLHFLKPDRDEPLKLVWIEDRNYQLYEVSTMVIGGKNVFAAKLIGPAEALKDGDIPTGYYLGFYEFASEDKITFALLDSEKVGELIAKGRLKGTQKPGKYEFATLTGSPAELARFLASPEAQAASMSDPATIRRLTRAPK